MLRTCLTCGFETQDEIAICPADNTLLKKTSKDPLIGTIFQEKYEITELLGKGGMSAVYKARHVLIDRYVALKLLRPELTDDGVSMQRFQREGKAVCLLRHPNVMEVTDFGITNDSIPYMIMEYLEGTTLSAVIRAEGQLHPARVVFLFTQACDALAHAHGKGVVHRDIKPSNLMVERNEREIELIKLVDFGIAKLLELNKSSPQLTTTGEVFGSPYYMSPEQCSGKPTDARSDIYSLGCVIYECLTGIPPIRGETAIETICKHISDAPVPFAEIRPDLSIPIALENAVFKAMEKDPEKRYQSMSELETDLQSAYPEASARWTSSLIKKTNVNAISESPNIAAQTSSSIAAPNTVATKVCSKCTKSYADSLAFCTSCGEPSQNALQSADRRICQQCGSIDELNSIYCISCGSKIEVQNIQRPAVSQRNWLIPLAILSVLVVAVGLGFMASQHAQHNPIVANNEPDSTAQTTSFGTSLLKIDSCTLKGKQQEPPVFDVSGGRNLPMLCEFSVKHPCHVYLVYKDSKQPKPQVDPFPYDPKKPPLNFSATDPQINVEEFFLASDKEIPWLELHRSTSEDIDAIFKKLSKPGMWDSNVKLFAANPLKAFDQDVSVAHVIYRPNRKPSD